MAPNVQKDYAELPAMGKACWDGIPYTEFNDEWFEPLKMALGMVSENGYTLLATCYTNDAGGVGPLANPHYNAANAQQRQQNQNRITRAFACILNYILSTSWVYRYMMRNFGSDGVAVFRFLGVFGQLPYTPLQRRRFLNEWEELKIRTLRIKIDVKTLFTLAEHIHKLARKITKSHLDMKAKFLEALPEACTHIKSIQMRNTAHVGYAFPATYPVYFPNGLAGTPHPFSGQPDINQLARFINEEWIELVIHRAIKDVPHGLVAQVDALSIDGDNPDEVAAVSAEAIDENFDCLYCGGSNHAVETAFQGKVVVCAAKLIGKPPISPKREVRFRPKRRSSEGPKREHRSKSRSYKPSPSSSRYSSKSPRRSNLKKSVSNISQTDEEQTDSEAATSTNGETTATSANEDSVSDSEQSESSDEVAALSGKHGRAPRRK
jgi:hypothetical protein